MPSVARRNFLASLLQAIRPGYARAVLAMFSIVLAGDLVVGALEAEAPQTFLLRAAILVGAGAAAWHLAARVLRLADSSQDRLLALELRLDRQAFHDPLTGLPNRGLFLDRLEHALSRRIRSERSAAILFIDLDDFKGINDTLGHVEGDLLIRLVAARLTETIRPEDTAARLGGDEFAILLEDVNEEQAAEVGTRVLAALETSFHLTDRTVHIGASIGIALSSPDVASATDLVRAADIAMYDAKGAGKGQFRVFEQAMYEAATERVKLGVDIRAALDRDELVVHYLPTVLLPSGTIVGMEALVRWRHPKRGLLPAAEFVPLAEETGAIVPIGEFVLREACRQARAWQLARPGEAPLVMSVNISRVELQHAGFVGSVGAALEDSELPAELLSLDIGERVLAGETDAAVRRLRQLKGLGVGIAIDDFGSGSSSLGYLRRFPVDTVKIAKSFVDGVATGTDAQALTRAIVRLAHSLKMKTVAEGVETDAQAQRLSSLGCDQAQGYFFGHPVDAAEATIRIVGHTTISLWTGHSDHELEVIKSVVAGFEAREPGLRVDVVGGMDDDRIIAALNSAQVPNVVSSFESDHFGAYTAGGLTDLRPYLERDGIDTSVLTDVAEAGTVQEGRRWALPLLADTYGLYFNRELFSAAGLSDPPRTISQLTEYAKRLTTRHPDGSLAVVGFDPTLGFYENFVGNYGHMFGARWSDASGRSSLATDGAWARMLRWQKALIDWYGWDDLVKFHDSVGDEFSPSNAFAAGRLAISVDGEWRIAFMADDAPGLDYGTAPLPADDDRPETYGSGHVNGSIVGIPTRAGHQDQAWRLVRYLALDHGAQVELAKGLRNLPSTRSAVASPDLRADARFAVFLGIYAHPRSSAMPMTAVGSAYQEGFSAFVSEWQMGEIADLEAGLRALDREIDAQLSQARAEAPVAGVTRGERRRDAVAHA